MQKSDREIMEILEAYDLTRCPHSAADLAGCDPKTVARTIATITKDANSGNPVPVGIDWLNDKGHKILVESIKNGLVTYLNPYGTREQMTLADFTSRLEDANLPPT